jgi:L-fucose isomerase-like protein
LINSGAATLDATGQQKEDGKSTMKPFWEITEEEVKRCLENTRWSPANLEYFRGGGYSSTFYTQGAMLVTMVRINLIDSHAFTGVVLTLTDYRLSRLAGNWLSSPPLQMGSSR